MSKRPTEISILVASDWAPIRAFEPIVRESPEAVYGDLLPVLRGADLRIVNCECALTAAETPVWKSGAVFKGLPGHVAGLTCVPFEIACLANNHVFDYGLAGFRETLKTLGENGILTVGAGLDFEAASAPLTVSVKGTRVTVVNFGEGEDLTASRGGPGTRGWDIDEPRRRIIQEAQKARRPGHRRRPCRPGVRSFSAALRRADLPGPGRRGRGLRRRPSSPCPPGYRSPARPPDLLQPGKFRVLPAAGPRLPEDGLLPGASVPRKHGLGLRPVSVPDHGAGAPAARPPGGGLIPKQARSDFHGSSNPTPECSGGGGLTSIIMGSKASGRKSSASWRNWNPSPAKGPRCSGTG